MKKKCKSHVTIYIIILPAKRKRKIINEIIIQLNENYKIHKYIIHIYNRHDLFPCIYILVSMNDMQHSKNICINI